MASDKLKTFIYFTLLSLFLFSCSESEFSSTDCGGTDCEVVAKSTDWEVGEWGRCSRACGGGIKTRSVVCRNAEDIEVPDSECSGAKPATQTSCGIDSCEEDYEWNVGDWGSCSQSCEGTRYRDVTCQDTTSGAFVADSNCTRAKPISSQSCGGTCPEETFFWHPGDWDRACACDVDRINRNVDCKNQNTNVTVADSYCEGQTKPETTKTCSQDLCNYTYNWVEGTWSQCSKECGGGKQTRSLGCMRNDGVYVPHTLCNEQNRPETERACNTQSCPPTCNKKNISATVEAADNQLDILLVVDDSGSMYQDTSRLASRLSGFVNKLDGSNINWQMCVTSTDVDYFQGRPIDWQSTNAGKVLRRNSGNLSKIFIETMKWIGAGFSSDEQGIKAMNLAVKHNGGCFRDKAALQVIVISDEDERSVGGIESRSPNDYKPLRTLNQPSSFVQTVNQEFSSGKRVVVNSIVVKDNTCRDQQTAQGERAFIGTKYIELSQMTNGNVESICSPDYSDCLDLFYEDVTNTLGSINLSCNPQKIDSVRVNGNNYLPYVTIIGNRLIFNPVVEGPANVTGQYCCPTGN